MKIILCSILLSFTTLIANGVGIVDATKGEYLLLLSSNIDVNVENQVAVIKSRQVFKNQYSSIREFKFAFPLPAGATATNLRWKISGLWHEAAIGVTPQDTTLPGSGGEISEDLVSYLGDTPLYFKIPNEINPDSLTEIEITYVELLQYSYGNVSFIYPNDYRLIQSHYLNNQSISFLLKSERDISDLSLISSHPISEKYIDINQAGLSCNIIESPAVENYEIVYSLSLEDLGLFSLSTLIPANELPDQLGGFFLFAAEPDPSNTTETINKVFTLIIDRSGSMEWENRLIQAKRAASYIIENLNVGDKFNIVDFARFATNFSETHLEYNSQNKAAALEYIDELEPTWTAELSGTNISGAFEKAIPQFSNTDANTANIIIFLTDGEATWGIQDTEGIISHVQSLVTQYEINLSIFTFGLGLNINEQLLTLLASQNKGEAEFVENDEVENKIIEFYRKIQNPVLLDVTLSFTPSIINETYPQHLPNLYKGQQFILTGRYKEITPLTVTLSGNAFGNNIEYTYQLNLSDSASPAYQFLPKIWAKNKIESLLTQYYSLESNSSEAKEIKSQIITISVSYGVLSPFTSFSSVTGIEDDVVSNDNSLIITDFELLGNYPNPFNPTTKIRFKVNIDSEEFVFLKIYNPIGELVRILEYRITGRGVYEFTWDGTDGKGNVLPSGNYIYLLNYGSNYLSGKMLFLK